MTIDVDSDKYSSLPKTIVVKFNEQFDFPYVDNLQQRFKELSFDALDKFFQKYPNITLNRLFSSISSEEITKLMSEASGKQNYKPVNLLRYYRIVVPPNISPEEIVSELKRLTFFEEVSNTNNVMKIL